MLTILFMLWTLIRNITRSVTGRAPPPQSLTPEEGRILEGSSSSSNLGKMCQDEEIRKSGNGIYSVERERRRVLDDELKDDVGDSFSPSPEPIYSPSVSPEPAEFLSEISNATRISSDFSHRSRYSIFSRDSSIDTYNDSRPSVTSLSSYSTSSRRYEIVGQRSMDSRASVSSLWSSDLSSRRESEAIPEHEIDSSDSTRTSLASNDSRRLSENLAKRRRSSARSAQIRRFIRRAPLSYDRRRTTGRLIL